MHRKLLDARGVATSRINRIEIRYLPEEELQLLELEELEEDDLKKNLFL